MNVVTCDHSLPLRLTDAWFYSFRWPATASRISTSKMMITAVLKEDPPLQGPS